LPWATPKSGISRDRRIVQAGAELASQAEQGLGIARGLEDQAANTYKIYIPNGLYASGLGTLVEEARTLGHQLTNTAGRSTEAVVHKLNALCEQLTSDAGSRG
jgi:hypothetical protein